MEFEQLRRLDSNSAGIFDLKQKSRALPGTSNHVAQKLLVEAEVAERQQLAEVPNVAVFLGSCTHRWQVPKSFLAFRVLVSHCCHEFGIHDKY